MPCALLNAICLSRRRVVSSIRALHGTSHLVAIEDCPPVQVTRSPTDGLDERSFGAQEAFLVGIEAGHERNFRHVEPLAQEVDADKHV